MNAPTAELARLAVKYRTLAALRRDKAEGRPEPPRATFRALASEFPGSLRELDLAPMDLLEARAVALEAASEAGGPREAWMDWLWAHHALLRAALRVRAAGAAGASARLDVLTAEARKAAGLDVTEAFVVGALAPPNGRLVHLVEDEIGRAFGLPPARLRETLFPFLRRARRG